MYILRAKEVISGVLATLFRKESVSARQKRYAYLRTRKYSVAGLVPCSIYSNPASVR